MKKSLKILLLIVPFLPGINCDAGSDHADNNRDYREDMRNFVIGISKYAKEKKPGFIVIAQNACELITNDGEPVGPLALNYLSSLDGQGCEELFYGWDNQDDQQTPAEETQRMSAFLDIAESHLVEAMVTDYCFTHSKMDASYSRNSSRNCISFAADHGELDDIPDYPTEPYRVNSFDINSLSDAKNFLYLINPSRFSSKEDLIRALKQSRYDLLLTDLFFDHDILTVADSDWLRTKENGGQRLLIAYISIGEAESYRYYWKSTWNKNRPIWLGKENPDWEGNCAVKYWFKEWQDIIFGNDNSYIKKIIDAGFDGVYLDKVDEYEYFEKLKTPTGFASSVTPVMR